MLNVKPYFQELRSNSISMNKVVKNWVIEFVNGNPKSEVWLNVERRFNLFTVKMTDERCYTLRLWRPYFKYLNNNILQNLHKQNAMRGLNYEHPKNDKKCKSCMLGKIHALSFFSNEWKLIDYSDIRKCINVN